MCCSVWQFDAWNNLFLQKMKCADFKVNGTPSQARVAGESQTGEAQTQESLSCMICLTPSQMNLVSFFGDKNLFFHPKNNAHPICTHTHTHNKCTHTHTHTTNAHIHTHTHTQNTQTHTLAPCIFLFITHIHIHA